MNWANFVVTFIGFVDFKQRSARKGGTFFPLIILLSINKQNLQFRNMNKLTAVLKIKIERETCWENWKKI